MTFQPQLSLAFSSDDYLYEVKVIENLLLAIQKDEFEKKVAGTSLPDALISDGEFSDSVAAKHNEVILVNADPMLHEVNLCYETYLNTENVSKKW